MFQASRAGDFACFERLEVMRREKCHADFLFLGNTLSDPIPSGNMAKPRERVCVAGLLGPVYCSVAEARC
jgi:hypothetical protein